MTDHYCYLDDKLIPESKASINVYDIGFLRGYGVFDFLRTYNGKPFLLDEHIDRLENSSNKMGIKLPYNKYKIKKIVNTLIVKNNTGESTIRIIVTGGVSPDGMNPGENPTFLILTRDLKHVSMETYEKGVKLLTDEYQRNLHDTKHLNYSNLVRLKESLKKSEAFNLLYVKNGNVLESAICNFFIVKDGVIVTSKENILMGTIRNLIIKLASDKYKVEERQVSVAEIDTADEAFITGTTQGIVPVVDINGKKIGSGSPGPVTRKLGLILDKYISKFSGGVGLFQID